MITSFEMPHPFHGIKMLKSVGYSKNVLSEKSAKLLDKLVEKTMSIEHALIWTEFCFGYQLILFIHEEFIEK